ncbi:putative pectinesterase 63 [Jatropha curcas]|uniref:putative pectinesterase 63 n=1 Tax=Jatropha curcas TaxID=180498 RepID=UPI0005FBEA22|nr:putative pectinesterase 63 [Jatropha curcas]
MVKHLSFTAFLQCTILSILLAALTVCSNDATPIPPDKSQVQSWFAAHVKPLASRKGTLNSTLEAAEAKPKTIKVRQDGSGNFKTITDAVNSVPAKNAQRVIIDIGPGVYTEKVTIPREKPFITFRGPPKMATLQFGGTAAKYGTVYSATLQVESEFFVAANLIIKNTAPQPDGKRKGAQAVALRTGASMQAFYNVRLLGFQDTLCDDKGFHFFKDCYIEGTVDFIFGSGKSIYLNTQLYVLEEKDAQIITAQAREKEGEDIGYSFVHCDIKGVGNRAFLGRAWMAMPRVVFAYSSMSSVVHPEGWSNNNHPEREKNLYFGEFKNTGPGSNPKGRAKFSKQLSFEEAKPFLTLGFIKGSSWLLPPP